MIQEQPSKTWIPVTAAIITGACAVIAAIVTLGAPFAERMADRYFPITPAPITINQKPNSVNVIANPPTQSLLSAPTLTPAVLEVLAVPTDGSVVRSQMVLVRGVYYTLRVSGTFVIGLDGYGDAEYAFSSSNSNVLNNCENDPANVDVGLALEVFGNMKLPSWGEFNTSHVYEYGLVGNGVPLSLQYNDCYWADNEGHLKVEIWQGKVGN